MADERDGSLAGERTLLAWTRSALAVAAIGALGLRAGATHQSAAAYLLGGVLLAAAAATFAYGHMSYRGRMSSDEPQSQQGVMRTVALATAITGLAGILLSVQG